MPSTSLVYKTHALSRECAQNRFTAPPPSLTFISYICTVPSRVKMVYHASYVEKQSSHLCLGLLSFISDPHEVVLLHGLEIVNTLVHAQKVSCRSLLLCHGYNRTDQCQHIPLGYTFHSPTLLPFLAVCRFLNFSIQLSEKVLRSSEPFMSGKPSLKFRYLRRATT